MITVSIRHRGDYPIIAGSCVTKEPVWNAGHHLTNVELAHGPLPPSFNEFWNLRWRLRQKQGKNQTISGDRSCRIILKQLLALLEISALAHRLFNYDLKVERATCGSIAITGTARIWALTRTSRPPARLGQEQRPATSQLTHPYSPQGARRIYAALTIAEGLRGRRVLK